MLLKWNIEYYEGSENSKNVNSQLSYLVKSAQKGKRNAGNCCEHK